MGSNPTPRTKMEVFDMKLNRRYNLEERMNMPEGEGTGRSLGSNKRIKYLLDKRVNRKTKRR